MLTLNCRVYNAGLDSLPAGNPIASATVLVDSNFFAGNLGQLRKSAVFSNPVTLNAPFVLTIESVSASNIAVVCNDWGATPADGGGEWLGMASLPGTGWLHGYGLNVGGVPFDCDFVCQPEVEYDLTTDFTASPTCFTGPSTVTFTNTSSPIIFNRMYNVAAFTGQIDLSFGWDWGDGTGMDDIVDTTHAYTAGGNFSVTLSDTLFGWTTTCTDDTTKQVGNVGPVSAFSSNGNLLVWTFTDQSSNGANGWLWDFGDGNTTTTQNAVHTYATAGNYTVCLTVTNACGADSSCTPITVSGCPAPVAGYSSSATELVVDFTSTSTGTATLTYAWDFGDGNTSAVQNPTHTYGAPGTYTVCLIVADNCGIDTLCTPVTVTCVLPTSGFTASASGLDVTFSNTSTGANS